MRKTFDIDIILNATILIILIFIVFIIGFYKGLEAKKELVVSKELDRVEMMRGK